jgi:HlyD family secretion protein
MSVSAAMHQLSDATSPDFVTRQRPARLTKVRVILLVMAVAIPCAAWRIDIFRPPEPPALHTVTKGPFRLEVEARGVIEPLSTVRVRSECDWTVRILSIVPEGTFVKKGDVVCVLESSEIEEFLRSREVYLIKARASEVTSAQKEELQLATSERRLSEARNALKMAELDHTEYVQAAFPEQTRSIRSDIDFTDERLTVADDELAFVEKMFALGLSNRANVDTASLKRTTESEALRRLEGELSLLEQFAHPRTVYEKEYQVRQSRLSVLRTELANSLAMSRAKIETLAEQRRRDIYERYVETARSSIEACTIRAPRDGQVIYANSWSSRSRGYSNIEEGKSVYHTQPIFEIPDADRYKVLIPLNESLITHVAVGMPVTVRPVSDDSVEVSSKITRISPYPISSSSYTPGVKEFMLDVVLNMTEEIKDVLQPRMDALASLAIEERLNAITVPRSAIIRLGGKALVLLSQGEKLIPCPVQAGEIANGDVLIESGLQEGDQVVAAISDDQKKQMEVALNGSFDAAE